MVTATVQIGNTDDKLSQYEWSEYVRQVQSAIDSTCDDVHFFGGSHTWAVWQNVCWVFAITEEDATRLKKYLTEIRIKYRQDSVALTFGETQFV